MLNYSVVLVEWRLMNLQDHHHHHRQRLHYYQSTKLCGSLVKDFDELTQIDEDGVLIQVHKNADITTGKKLVA
ncbi:MAG: hypothetical protein AAF587_44875, partial [Bacteroidota bacterium]